MPEVPALCPRWLRSALGEYLVANIFLRWLRHVLGRYEVAEVCPRWSQ
jgi:hypothetical protein